MESLLKLERVSVIRDGQTILDNLCWEMNRNEHWAVIGRNGAGKSFLLQLLSAQFHPTSGVVHVMGERLGRVNVWDLRAKIGLVSDALQRQYHEFVTVLDVTCSGFFASIGVYDNISTNQKETAQACLDTVGLVHLSDRKFGSLSHGEQRRVLIARALVHDPQMLVLDEPCSGLDIPSRERFLADIQRLGEQGRNLIVVTHHLEEVMPIISHVLLLKDGKGLVRGRKDTVLTEANLHQTFDYAIPLTQSDGRFWPTFF
jgi:iron complex transport system ATP-binding protein